MASIVEEKNVQTNQFSYLELIYIHTDKQLVPLKFVCCITVFTYLATMGAH